MKTLILILIGLGLAVYFGLVDTKTITSYTGKAVNASAKVVGQVADVVNEEVVEGR